MSEGNASVPRGRMMSIDALRGFDMFWIVGGKEVLFGLFAALAVSLPSWLERHLEHPRWEGFVAWDMIMPLFLFIAGVSMPFSFKNRIEKGQQRRSLYLKIIRRVIILWVLGMIAQGNLLHTLGTVIQGNPDFSRLLLYSNTLQAIAAGYLIAAVLLLHFPAVYHLVVAIGLLVGYWALLVFVPFQGQAAGTLEPAANFARYVDKTVLGQFSSYPPYTWVLSSMGFGATVLLGVMAGHILLSSKTSRKKLLMLIGAGLACLATGALWSFWFPFIKHIWTSSMALWAAGWSFLLLALFYWIVDVMEWRAWSFPFRVIGMNAIIAYMAWPFLVMLSNRIVRGAMGPSPVLLYVSHVLLFVALWSFLFFLYRRNWFLRI